MASFLDQLSNAPGLQVAKNLTKGVDSALRGAAQAVWPAGGGPAKAAGRTKAAQSAKTQSTQSRTNESVDTTLSDIGTNPAKADFAPDPFDQLNSLIPDPLTMQLFYDQTVAPLIQSQVKQMTQYGDLLKNSGGGGALGGINQDLGNQYGALAAALGAQTAQQPSFDALMQNVTQAKQQQTDIYSLIRSLIASKQQPAGVLEQALALGGITPQG